MNYSGTDTIGEQPLYIGGFHWEVSIANHAHVYMVYERCKWILELILIL